MSYLLETREIGDYRISVYQDEWAECPCTGFDYVGTYIFEDCSRYNRKLSASCNYTELFSSTNHDLRDALCALVCKYVSQKKIVAYINKYCHNFRMRYDKSDHMWYLEALYEGKWYTREEFYPSDLKDFDYREELCDVLDSDDIASLLYDCKGVAFKEWSSSGYCQGDCIDGFVYCDKERFKKLCDANTTNWRSRALDLFDGEIKTIGMWAWGDVKGYTLEKRTPFKKVYKDEGREPEDAFDWEEIESVWGYFMDTDELIDCVIQEADIPKTA